MIDALHDVEINGVKYLLAESAEGLHYDLAGESLRPPNAVMVQGEGRQDKFQARPDMLLWNITDWSGGEGQIVFNPSAHNRHAILQNVDPFTRPGTLQPGMAYEVANDNVDAPFTGHELVLTRVGIWIYGVSRTTVGKYYTWDASNDRWNAQSSWAGPTAVPTPGGVSSDDDYVWFIESGTANLWRANASGITQFTNAGMSTSTKWHVLELGNYVYLFRPESGQVYAVSKTDTPMVTPTELFNGDNYSGSGGHVSASGTKWGMMTRGNNRVYVLGVTTTEQTVVIEIVPTSAAGPGYGREIARFPGFVGTSMTWHSGTLFVGGVDNNSASTRRSLLYFVPPDGDYGALGRVRQEEEESYDGYIRSGPQLNLLTMPFATSGTTDPIRLWAMNSLTGGIACIAATAQTYDGYRVLQLNNDMFFDTTDRVLRFIDGQYTELTSYATTPWHDMGLSDEKILSSLVLSVEAMPADWAVKLSYAVNGSTSFTVAGTYSTTSGTGTRYAVSTDTTTKKFRTLRIKIEFVYSGGGSPTTAPTVHGVEVRAQVAKPVPVWNLLLDLSDDHSNASQSHAGSFKYTNIKTAGDLEAVVAFKDGYPNREPGVFTEYDVVVDSYRLILDRPGEGVAAVSLREVI